MSRLNMKPVDLKIVLLGKDHCGKTSLVERFIYNRFREGVQSTIGAAFGAKRITVDDEVVTLGIWDTAGSERYESMSGIYYRSAGAAIICYEITDQTSFEKAKFWISELRKHEEKCKIYLCGTKVDLIKVDKKLRKVDFHDVSDYADEIGAVDVFETSSKDNSNVYDLFVAITRDYIYSKERVVAAHDGLGLEALTLQSTEKTNDKFSCC